MKTETHLYKNRKTLVWLQNSPETYEHPERFRCWNTVVTSPSLAESWKECLGQYPSAIVLTNPTEESRVWLETKAPKQKQILFLNRKVISLYGVQQMSKENFVNVVCLEEMAEMFPFIYHKYQDSDSDALTILTIGILFRVHRIFGDFGEDAKTFKNEYSISIRPIQEPEPLWLIQQYFIPSKARREKEIKHCLEKNLENPFINKIILLNEEDLSSRLPKHRKLEQHNLGHRLTYADVIRFIQEKVPEGVIVCFANSDIYLDSSFSNLWSLDMKDIFLALLRYEESDSNEEPKLFGPREDSQDAWILDSNSVKARNWKFEALDFPFGKAGCDNAIGIEMLKQKFKIANPSLTLRSIHCHASQIRTYNQDDIVDKPIYLYLEPTGLHDLDPLGDLKPFQTTWPRKSSAFSRRINSADEKHLKTFCAMVSRDETLQLKPDQINLFEPNTEEKLYSFTNAFTTTNGLVYGYDNLFLGKNQKVREEWAKTTISHMIPCIGVKSVLAVPFPDELATNMWSYMTNYLAKVLRLKDAGFEGEFWLPREQSRLQAFLQHFKWKEDVMPVIPRDEDVVAFAPKTYMLEPREQPFIYKEEIDALRQFLQSYSPTVQHPKRITIIQDDDIINAENAIALEDALENLGYETNVVYLYRSSIPFLLQRFMGIEFCVAPKGCEALFWLLPIEAKVLEVMPEMSIQGNGAHMAGACSLEYWVTLIPRAKGDAYKQLLLERVCKNVLTMSGLEKRVTAAPSSKPTIIMPPHKAKGIHNHKGDSFREMVELWHEQDKIQLEISSETPYVWWSAVGETLLYDRASYEWLEETPATYKKILCGNPDAEEIPKGVQWSFWPRHPRLVEARVQQGLPNWSERSKRLVFYGRIENEIQKDHRSNELWKACDEFDMPLKANEPYKYSPEEYLNRLADSKFGLCLAGFGLKCNREIECMAMGCIPVVAPYVDMEKYHDPPKEGIHYICLKSYDPEEAKNVLESITEEKGQQMSKAAHEWWKKNASAEGLFEITQKLA